MPGNRSLDEFAADEASEPAGDAAAGSAGGDAGEEPADPTGAPILETFAWTAAGGTCARCGDTVESRWRDGDALVCGDCKAW